jgi:hypothetical protein
MKTIILVVGLLLVGCTDQIRAKQYGGNASMSLPTGQKVVCATWKENNLWVLTRPMREGEKVETFTLRESSSWGVMQGTVTITER